MPSPRCNTHEWCADNVVPQIDKLQNVPLEAFSLWMSQLENNSNIIIESLESIREAHPEDYELLHMQGIHSLMVVPLHVDGQGQRVHRCRQSTVQP